MRQGVKSEWRKQELPLPSFDSVLVSKVLDLAGRDVGRSVKLLFSSQPEREVVIELPRDGDTVYFEDSEGNTTDSVRWFEPRSQRREMRVTDSSPERPACPPNKKVLVGLGWPGKD